MQFYTDSNMQAQKASTDLFATLKWFCVRTFSALFVKARYRIHIDEGIRAVTLAQLSSKSGIMQTPQTPQTVVKSWISPFGCWLATENFACFLSRGSLSESQFRCICRILNW